MKRIAKLIAGTLALVGLLSLSACGAAQKTLYAQGLEVVQLMWEVTQSEEYLDAYTGSSQLKEIVRTIGDGDYTAPTAVYAITVADEDLAAMADLYGLELSSGSLHDYMMQRVRSSLITQINSLAGVEQLAASSVCSVGKTFVNEDAEEDVIYLYTFDDAAPAAVTFTVGEDHAVSASGVFVLYDDFTCDSAEEIESFFSYVTVTVQEVAPEP